MAIVRDFAIFVLVVIVLVALMVVLIPLVMVFVGLMLGLVVIVWACGVRIVVKQDNKVIGYVRWLTYTRV